MTFNKNKMAEWLESHGHDVKDYANDMDRLHGKQVTKNNWKACVHDIEEYYIKIDGQTFCILKEWCD